MLVEGRRGYWLIKNRPIRTQHFHPLLLILLLTAMQGVSVGTVDMSKAVEETIRKTLVCELNSLRAAWVPLVGNRKLLLIVEVTLS